MATRTFEFSWILTPVGDAYSSLDPDTRHERLAVAFEQFAGLTTAGSQAMTADLTVDVTGEAAMDHDPVKSKLMQRASDLAAENGFWSGFGLSFDLMDTWEIDPGPPMRIICTHGAPTNKSVELAGSPALVFRIALVGTCKDCSFESAEGGE